MPEISFLFKEALKPTWKMASEIRVGGAIEYPIGPRPWVPGPMMPGEGIYAAPFECECIIDVFAPPGKMDAIWGSFLSTLGKWGYEVKKVNEVYEVSPAYTEYYQRIIGQKRAWENEIKAAFASLSKSIEDFELLTHDLRKYAEYLSYYENLQRAKKEKKEEEIKKANHIFRAIFVDQVDVYTGEGLSMRSIAPRWPTIIADFMELGDEDLDFKKIAKKLNVSKAEAVILATKNRLFLEWRDRMFIPMIKQRYSLLRRLVEARRHSIMEYREQLRIMMARYEYIKEMKPHFFENVWWWRPGTIPLVVSMFSVWAWKPFGLEEKHKAIRENMEYVTAREAGFNKKEIEELKKAGVNVNKIPGLPVEPAYDKWVRYIKDKLEKAYGVKLTPIDVCNVMRSLASRFIYPEVHELTGGSGLKAGEAWPYSPYYILLEIGVTEQILKLPNGVVAEDFWIQPLKSSLATQNIIIGKNLELIAKERYVERKVSLMLGEYGVSKEGLEKIDKIIQQEFPETFGAEVKKEEKKPSFLVELKESINKFKENIAKVLDNLGIRLTFMYPGPYEPIIYDRIAEYYFPVPGKEYGKIIRFLKKAIGVPG